MNQKNNLYVSRNLTIKKENISFEFSRSSGPGGQNVNKVNTKVVLILDLDKCTSLTNSHKKLIMEKLHTRITKENLLRIQSQKHRTQLENREEAINKLIKLLKKALQTNRKRKKTNVPKHAVEKRLKDKKLKSEKKKNRSSDTSFNDY